MKVQRYEVPEKILATIEAWMRYPARGFTAAALEAEAIQKHRKAGNIVVRSQQGERTRWGWKS